MFAEVIRGTVVDAEAAAGQFRGWEAEVAPGAPGWHDVTGGVTAGGELLVVARFASDADARANSLCPDQDRWRKDTAALFTDEPTFFETTDVTELRKGGMREAGFVQMMVATVADRRTAERIEEELDEPFRRWRPDAVGAYRVWLRAAHARGGLVLLRGRGLGRRAK